MIRKYISVLFLASIAVAGCGNAENKTESPDQNSAVVTNTAAKSEEPAGKSIKMTKAIFLDKVMDYEANPEDWIYKGDKPCLIDFYADWCGPCKIASPILEELAAEYHGKIYIYKVDTEVERELASIFGIRSIPAFLFVPQEGKPQMSNGIARSQEETKEMFRNMIDEILLGEAEKES
jgi:thioredoxin